MRTEPPESRDVRTALDNLVHEADKIAKLSTERGRTNIFTLASDALQTAAKAAFELMDALDEPEEIEAATDQAREQLLLAQAWLRQAEAQLSALPAERSSDAFAKP